MLRRFSLLLFRRQRLSPLDFLFEFLDPAPKDFCFLKVAAISELREAIDVGVDHLHEPFDLWVQSLTETRLPGVFHCILLVRTLEG